MVCSSFFNCLCVAGCSSKGFCLLGFVPALGGDDMVWQPERGCY